MHMKYIPLAKCARTIVNTCAKVKPKERVTIITDFEQTRSIPETIAAEAHASGGEVFMVNMFPARPFKLIPETILAAMQKSDVIFSCTYRGFPFLHAKEKQKKLLKGMLEGGSRYIQMHMLTEDLILRTVPVDYDRIQKQTSILSELLPKTERGEIVSSIGTNLTFQCKDRKMSFVWDGLCQEPGEWDAIPGGIVGISPMEGTVNGTVVFNGCLHYRQLGEVDDYMQRRMGRLWEPIRLKVKNSRVTDIQGGWMAKLFKGNMQKGDENANNFAEIAIGLNPGAKPTGFLLEDERVSGSIFTEFGDSVHAFGKVKSDFRVGMTMLGATLKLDGKIVIENGLMKI